jgi:hypothetical protein
VEGQREDPQGLECTSCHEAHGNWGALINRERGVIRTTADGDSLSDNDAWVENAQIYVGTTLKYLHLSGTVWQGCTAPNAGGTCTDLTTTDSEGQTVYFYGYKLLSGVPELLVGQRRRELGGRRESARPGSLVRRVPHPSRPFGVRGTYHNHPTGCTACHGNPSADQTSKDFPHTSTFGDFLLSYPDGLCIGSCHTAGSLP